MKITFEISHETFRQYMNNGGNITSLSEAAKQKMLIQLNTKVSCGI